MPVTLFLWNGLQAQIADTLNEVHVKGRRRQPVSNDERINTFSPGQRVKTIDSITLQQYQFQSMANLLAQQTPVFVKSYGFNSLSTINFRGASAAQSQVYWNGIPIQNAALGMADVSLLPVSLMDKVNIVYGGSSALWGSGNVGGALLVENNRPVFDEDGSSQYAASAVAGSFNQYQLGLRASLSTRKWYMAANAFGQSANNGFSYTDNGIEKKTANSKLRSGVAMLNAGYKANDKNTLGFTAWYQQYYREIPAALFESVSVKNQRDEALRLLAEWNRQGAKTAMYAKLAYIRDYMMYNDSFVLLRSNNVTNQVYGEAGIKYRIDPHQQFLVFVPVHISWIDRQVYNDVKTQNKMALAAAYSLSYFDNKLNVSASARGEAIDNKTIFLPGINASFSFTDWLAIRANVQRSYRAPNLYELYYQPGGNPLLKPEYGWSEDAGYQLKTSADNRLVLEHDVSLFNRVVNDWILWFGGSVWTPHNIATVHSRGIETDNRLQWQSGNWKLHIGVNTSYVLATTTTSYLPGDSSIGRQIPYTPRYNGQVNVGFSWKALYFNYNHTYTGYRFYTTDESGYLKPYNVGNVQVFYTTYIRSMPLQVSAQCNNIWNAQYQVVNARPMPGINWLLGVKASFDTAPSPPSPKGKE